MLPSTEALRSVVKKLGEHEAPSVVVDPVLVATSGDKLTGDQVAEMIIKELLPLATVVTPNIHEAEILSGQRITSLDDMESAARCIHRAGPQMVVVKGGHMPESKRVHDVIFDGRDVHILEHAFIETQRLHGTGCTLSSAIASYLAQGMVPLVAIRHAIFYLQDALGGSLEMDIGQGTQLPFHHGYRLHRWPKRRSFRTAFSLCLYGITDQRYNEKHKRSFREAVRGAIDGGVTILQIRDKDSDASHFLDCVKVAMEEAEQHGVPVIVNDRVDVAIAADADGIHVGQVHKYFRFLSQIRQCYFDLP